MSYSKELRALNTADVRVALGQLLGQLNLVQRETERQLEELRREIVSMKSEAVKKA